MIITYLIGLQIKKEKGQNKSKRKWHTPSIRRRVLYKLVSLFYIQLISLPTSLPVIIILHITLLSLQITYCCNRIKPSILLFSFFPPPLCENLLFLFSVYITYTPKKFKKFKKKPKTR